MTHGAVVAREYGIPAAAGMTLATTRLPAEAGQRIRVDGFTGRIRVWSRIPASEEQRDSLKWHCPRKLDAG